MAKREFGKSKAAEVKQPKCYGGQSYGCRRDEHTQGTKVFCDHCQKYLGCRRCCQCFEELFCFACQTWAKPAGLKKHGAIVADKGATQEVFKIIWMRCAGKVTQAEAEKLIRDVWAQF